jgi:hypothetical protein
MVLFSRTMPCLRCQATPADAERYSATDELFKAKWPLTSPWKRIVHSRVHRIGSTEECKQLEIAHNIIPIRNGHARSSYSI